jgi:hypothetical protein
MLQKVKAFLGRVAQAVKAAWARLRELWARSFGQGKELGQRVRSAIQPALTRVCATVAALLAAAVVAYRSLSDGRRFAVDVALAAVAGVVGLFTAAALAHLAPVVVLFVYTVIAVAPVFLVAQGLERLAR